MPECPTRAYNIAHVIFWSPDAFADPFVRGPGFYGAKLRPLKTCRDSPESWTPCVTPCAFTKLAEPDDGRTSTTTDTLPVRPGSINTPNVQDLPPPIIGGLLMQIGENVNDPAEASMYAEPTLSNRPLLAARLNLTSSPGVPPVQRTTNGLLTDICVPGVSGV